MTKILGEFEFYVEEVMFMSLLKKCLAEGIGTCVLVLFACGVAAFTGASIVPTALAFGLVIVAMAYSIGNISGCHINPAVSLGMAISKRMSWKDCGFYILSQVIGAFVGAFILALFMGGFSTLGGNEVQPAVLEAYSSTGDVTSAALIVGFIAEIILTFVFVIAVLGATDTRFHSGKHAGIVIGLALTLVHLLGLSITGTSVNPARSIAPSILQCIAGNTTSASQLWIWIIAPCLGGIIAAYVYQALTKNKAEKIDSSKLSKDLPGDAE